MLKKSLNASLSLLLCLSLLFAFAGTTHAQDNIDKKVKMAVDRALSDRGKIHLGSPPKYPYLFHTFWFEKGDWAWGMGLDFNYTNTVITDDDTNATRDFTGWDEIEYRFGARLDKWLDLYVTADFGANDDFAGGSGGLPGTLPGSRVGFNEGDVRWSILDLHGLPLGPFSNLRIGQQITPMTIDNWTSPQNGSFIHKSYMGAFAGAYHQGFTFWDFQVRSNPKLVYSFSVMKQTESGAGQPNHVVSGEDRDEWDDVDVMGQLGWHPWFRGPSDMLYFEVSGGIFKPDNGVHTFAFPGIGHGAPGSVPAVATLPAEEYTPMYLSARYGNGPFWAMAEFANVEADNCSTTSPPGLGGPPRVQACSSSSPSADGYHITLGYFLTGESKPWSPAVGVNGRAKPAKPFNPVKKGKEYGIGGWELKFRFQEIDMSDFGWSRVSSFPGGAIPSSERENMAIGLNWYLTENMIFMTEYETEEHKNIPGDPEVKLFNTQINLRM